MKEAVLVGAPAGPCRGTHQSLSGADPHLFYGAPASPRALAPTCPVPSAGVALARARGLNWTRRRTTRRREEHAQGETDPCRGTAGPCQVHASLRAPAPTCPVPSAGVASAWARGLNWIMRRTVNEKEEHRASGTASRPPRTPLPPAARAWRIPKWAPPPAGSAHRTRSPSPTSADPAVGRSAGATARARATVASYSCTRQY